MAQNHNRRRVINGPAAEPAADPAPKFWNIVTADDTDEAEITMYGPIVSRRPIDWWTGEPEPGLFVSPEEFLEDLAQVKDKGRITIRINSIGGDLYTALGICTQLRGLAATKTAIIDGIAASAATIIAMGCDTIKIPAGGLFMIHEASMAISGSFNHRALAQVNKQLEAANKSAAETYATKTGLATAAIRNLMAKETWMTGRDAVDKGFADELLEEAAAIVMSADQKEITVNGVRHSLAGFTLPAALLQTSVQASAKPAAPPPAAPKPTASTNTKKGGDKKMTMEELRAQYPDLVAQIVSETTETVRAQAITDERARIQGIEDIQASVGDPELVNAAKYGDKPMTAEQLAFQAMKKQAALGAQHLANAAADFTASGAAGVAATPNAGNTQTPDDKTEVANAAAMIAADFMQKEDKKND
jgi:ATP-dependent protease ClpP protease subunit